MTKATERGEPPAGVCEACFEQQRDTPIGEFMYAKFAYCSHTRTGAFWMPTKGWQTFAPLDGPAFDKLITQLTSRADSQLDVQRRVNAWMDDRCFVVADHGTTLEGLYRDYLAWHAIERTDTPVSVLDFQEALRRCELVMQPATQRPRRYGLKIRSLA